MLTEGPEGYLMHTLKLFLENRLLSKILIKGPPVNSFLFFLQPHESPLPRVYQKVQEPPSLHLRLCVNQKQSFLLKM